MKKIVVLLALLALGCRQDKNRVYNTGTLTSWEATGDTGKVVMKDSLRVK